MLICVKGDRSYPSLLTTDLQNQIAIFSIEPCGHNQINIQMINLTIDFFLLFFAEGWGGDGVF